MPSDEFELIRTLFAPLATSAGARGLLDDAAVLEAFGGLVVTTDAIVEGVHFFPHDPIDTVAKKALRVNLSDLAAKGAKPVGALLALIWPDARDAVEIGDFARGLGEDLRLFDVPLLGGDITATPGPLTIAITALGAPLGARTPSRADARPGEDLWLTGAVGDAFVGLQTLLSNNPDAPGYADAVARYRTPAPALGFAPLIARLAGAAMDVSDGLLADARKLAAASNVALRIEAARAPISATARLWLERSGAGLVDLLSGGDDYEILFTAGVEARAEIAGAGAVRIGAVGEGAGVELLAGDGAPIPLGAGGHVHRIGR